MAAGQHNLRRVAATAALIFAVIAASAVSIVCAYPIFSHTYDEPAHIAAGLELLGRGTYTYEQQHPPLARIAVAIGPYLTGARPHGEAEIFDEGLAVLYGSGDYLVTLSAARLGVLPFLIAVIALTAAWAYYDFGAMAAITSAVVLATTPPLLAHAGLATTDVPLTAMLIISLFAFRLWLDKPNARRSTIIGASTALAITAKLSALVFLPACFLAATMLRELCGRGERTRPSLARQAVMGLPGGILAFCFVLWLVYGGPADPLHPFEQLFAGVREVLEHNAKGHISFFCGQISFAGHWLFFPTALLIKTPVFALLLAAVGAIVILRRHRRDWRYAMVLGSAGAILGIAMLGRIDLGVRYVLPLYPLTAIIAGIGAAGVASRRSWVGSGMVGCLMLGQAAVAAASWPDYLPYFNVLAGSHPERLLVDSDLDWGQDVNRVAAELQRRGIRDVATALHGNADLSRHGFPRYTELEWDEPATGWIVVSQTRWSFGTGAPPFDGYRWLKRYAPVSMIGKTVRLYYIDPEDDGARPEK